MPEKQGDAKRAPHTRPADRQRPHSTSHRRRAERQFRRARLEVIYTVIENLTQDGRDRSLDYKLSGFNIAMGSWEARVVEDLAPQED
jgi:ureidoacrylate peracid hydrolase